MAQQHRQVRTADPCPKKDVHRHGMEGFPERIAIMFEIPAQVGFISPNLTLVLGRLPLAALLQLSILQLLPGDGQWLLVPSQSTLAD